MDSFCLWLEKGGTLAIFMCLALLPDPAQIYVASISMYYGLTSGRYSTPVQLMGLVLAKTHPAQWVTLYNTQAGHYSGRYVVVRILLFSCLLVSTLKMSNPTLWSRWEVVSGKVKRCDPTLWSRWEVVSGNVLQLR